MLRVYFDSNIFRNLKQGNQYNAEFHAATEQLKDNLIFCFSTAHLDDLRKSNESHRSEDLSLMEEYVGENYFYFDQAKKEFRCFMKTPIQAFNEIDYDLYEETLKDAFNIDKLLSGFEEFPAIASVKRFFSAYFDLPIGLFTNMNTEYIEQNDETKNLINKYIPTYNEETSVKDFMMDISPFAYSILTEDKKVTELRKDMSKYFNSDAYSFVKWGKEFNEKLKETALGKTFTELVDSMLTENQKSNYNLRFIYAYTLLELYNITQERTSKGVKKFNLLSLSTDASHAFFASHCDYLITNDKGMQVKASIVYEMMGVHTKVLSPFDFINLKNQILGQEETFERISKSLVYDINNAFLINRATILENGNIVEVYKAGHSYFNYFNQFQVVEGEKFPTYAFYCRRNEQANFIMYRELGLIITKALVAFGMDYEGKGEYAFKENNELFSGKEIRKWNLGQLKFTIVTSAEKSGNFILLVMEIAE